MGKRTKPADIESQYVPLPRNISAAGMELNPKVENTEDIIQNRKQTESTEEFLKIRKNVLGY